ncbi:hypothetical protein [Segatella salivae]|uniref:Uncharacterized protein n=1 Tax=Segatella salivae DSM 15606 TaxID=888832 RepID=E6MSN3_9BACT|nr:hypothetical protein [Segatella salivae]EFV03344.1 hypothetical protein HMPREF9420_2501 [Segatella salivae DSM 15606]
MNITIEKILEFHDLFPEEKEIDISSVLKKYSKKYLVLSSNVLSHNYGRAYIPDKNNTFFSSHSEKHLEDLNNRFEQLTKKSGQKIFCYCTTKTSLELMRIIFSIPINEYKNDGDIEDFEYDLFRVILQINENLMSFNSTNEQNLATFSFLNFFIMNDISGQDARGVFIRQVQYYSILSEFIETYPACGKAKETFYKSAGITKMSDYAKTWLALFTLEFEYQKKQGKGCPILDLNRLQDVDDTLNIAVLDFLSINLNEHILYNNTKIKTRDNNVDYRVFRSCPLIKIDDNKYIIYCFPILVERLYNSLFFDLKDSFKDAFNFYNKDFVEKVLFQPQVLQCLNEKITSKIYPSREMILCGDKIKEEDNQPDFYLRENDNLILFECKAIRINGELKDKSDIDELLSILKNKLYCSKENIDKSRGKKKKAEQVGVTQLVQQMKMIDADTFKWDNNIPDEVAYYPVIVLEDPRFVVPGLSYIINSWYQSLIEQELPEQMCHPIVVMSIDMLMLYSHIFKAEGFHNVFDKYFKQAVCYSANGVTWTFDPLADFNVFMQEKYKLSPQKKEQLFEIYRKTLGI